MSAEVPIAIVYAGPASCPDEAAFSRALAELGLSVVPATGARRLVSVQLIQKSGIYTLSLRYTDAQAGQERRELTDARCEVLVQSASTMAAVWSGVTLPAALPVVAPVIVAPAGALSAAAPEPVTRPVVAPSVRLRVLSVSAGPSYSLGGGDGMAGAEVKLRVAWARDDRPSWAWVAGVGYAARSSDAADFRSLYVPLRACPGGLRVGRLQASACARVEVGVLQGEGALQATPAPETQTRPWVAAGVSAEVVWAVAPRLGLGLELAPQIVLTRDTFTVGGRDVMKADFIALRGVFALHVPLYGALF